MIRHAMILVSAVVAIAIWAYGVNYKTMQAIERVADLRAQIADERETLQVLRVEWAYLNAPERLLGLVAQHNDRLRLVPLTPEVLQEVSVVPFPDPGDGTAEPPEPLISEGTPMPRARPVALVQP